MFNKSFTTSKNCLSDLSACLKEIPLPETLKYSLTLKSCWMACKWKGQKE